MGLLNFLFGKIKINQFSEKLEDYIKSLEEEKKAVKATKKKTISKNKKTTKKVVKKAVKTNKKKTPSKVKIDSSNLKEVEGKLSVDAKKDSKKIINLLKKFHSIQNERNVNNNQKSIDILDKIIPLIEKVQIPLYEAAKKSYDPDPEHGYSSALITYTDEEITFKYHYCELLYHRGTFKAMKGDISAINDLEKSTEIIKDETTLINLSLAYLNLSQDPGKSMNCIQECVTLFPNSTRAKEVQLSILQVITQSMGKE